MKIRTSGDCPFSSNALQSEFLVAGTFEGDALKVDGCSVIPKSAVVMADAYWLVNQLDSCGKISCSNGRQPLECLSDCDLNICPGSASCARNGCKECTPSFFTDAHQLKCGEIGGAEFEVKLCPSCKTDPCATAKKKDAGCEDWEQAEVCLSDPCHGCNRPIWLDSYGRQVCAWQAPSTRCSNLAGVNFPQNCSHKKTLGFGLIQSSCREIKGCSTPGSLALFDDHEACVSMCQCQDLKGVDLNGDQCDEDLGWAVVDGKCAKVKGCSSRAFASAVQGSIHETALLCERACAANLYDYKTIEIEGVPRPADWVEEANGKLKKPNYSRVYPQTAVNKMYIKVNAADWDDMESDLKGILENYHESAMQNAMARMREQSGGMAEEIPSRRQAGLAPDLVKTIQKGGIAALSPEQLSELIEKIGAPPPQLVDSLKKQGKLPSAVVDVLEKAAHANKGAAGADGFKFMVPPPDIPQVEMQVRVMTNPDGSCAPVCNSGGPCVRKKHKPASKLAFGERGIKFDHDPLPVSCTVSDGNHSWHNVGIRWKGDSSLSGAVLMGSYMRGFRLDFDWSDKDVTKGQHFFGFKKITFSNNFKEISHVREKMSLEIFGAGGLKAPRATMTRVYMDISDGNGPVFWGLYTMIEDPSDYLIKTFPGDNTPGEGNLYKPENNTWWSFKEDDFANKKDTKDFSDVQAAFAALHSPTRIRDPPTWRTGLDAVFDTRTFLKYMALNSLIGNWDSYGLMPHNYYLYNLNGVLTWMPWDMNEALNCDPRTTSVMKIEITDDWPLIRFLLDDPEYRALYKQLLRWAMTTGPFELSALIERKNQLVEMVTPQVLGGIVDGELLEPEEQPHSTIWKLAWFHSESSKIEAYLSQRFQIAQFELFQDDRAEQEEP